MPLQTLRDTDAGAGLRPVGCVNAGVRFMARELREHGPLTVFAIGPLTDIACLSVISRARRGGSTAWWRSWAAGGVAG